MSRQALSSNELAIMQALWSENAPMSRPEILEKVPDHDWNPNSIHLVLNNLIKKEFVTVGNIAKCGQRYGRTYLAIKSQGEYAAELALGAMPGIPEEQRIPIILAAMVKGKHISEETINMLQKILEELRQTEE